MTMEKYATDPLSGRERACDEAYDAKPGTNTPQDHATCSNCAHFSNASNTRGTLCPWATRERPRTSSTLTSITRRLTS